jgi:seryl-tRNA synthetase
LDQERKKDRARSLKEKCKPMEETKEFIHDQYFGNGEIDFMSEIENLEKEKVSLENETQSLETEQKQLMQKIKVHYQKTIEDLKIKNNAIREANNKLKERLDSLEESQESQESLSLGENARASIEELCGGEGDGEVDVSYWENSGTTSEDSSENVLDRSQQSKKLKLFRG